MTVAIYQATNDGFLRLGTFTARGAPSIRNVASQFYAKHPNLERERMFVAKRIKLFGRWVDSDELIPLG